jgi:hypothetical protein
MHIIKHFKLLVNASDHLLQLLLIQLLQLSTALRIRRHEIDFLLLLMEAQLTLLDTIIQALQILYRKILPHIHAFSKFGEVSKFHLLMHLRIV